MDESLIDTDILSEVLKGRSTHVLDHSREYLLKFGKFSFSSITRYEIVRGLLAARAERQLDNFLKLARISDVLPITENSLDRAASLWAEALRNGSPRNDADLLIAATAIECGRALVTGNSEHFSWIPQIRLQDWRSA